MSDDNAIVKEAFEIDLDELTLKAEDSDYWSSCLKFYDQVKDKTLMEISKKQYDWLCKIQESLEK